MSKLTGLEGIDQLITEHEQFDKNKHFNFMFIGDGKNSDESIKDLFKVFPSINFDVGFGEHKLQFLEELENVNEYQIDDKDEII